MSIIDVSAFQILQRQGYRVRRDSTLNCWKKNDLIALIRTLENNWVAALERCENQYKQLCECHEKQIPKKPLHVHRNYYCPVCKEDGWLLWDDVDPNDFDNYCCRCGQRIDWSELEE